MNAVKNLFVCKASAGTGKTYTLAAHYIALLMNGVSYKNILAVTFTTKATAEMKERIMTYLNAIATEVTLDDVKGFLQRVRDVSKERGLKEFTDAEYSTRAQELVKNLLSDYDNMRITTIDAFLQTLLMGMAQALGQAAGYGVDLDVKHAITTAVDEVLTRSVTDREILDAVVACLKERIAQEAKWSPRRGLIEMAEKLFAENVQMIQDQLLIISKSHPENRQKMKAYKESFKTIQEVPQYETLKTAFEKIKKYETTLGKGTGATNYKAFFRRCRNIVGNPTKDDFKGLGSTDHNRFDQPDKLPLLTEEALAELKEQVMYINESMPYLLQTFMERAVFLKKLDDMQLVGFVMERIQYALRENNTILLAETANKLSTALTGHDASFVLLKAGIRYHHIMLDEFQDTSVLQWEVFRQLIHEIVSSDEHHSALIVGDIKQSIYRWRNGEYEIMAGLDKVDSEPDLYHYYNEQNLVRNFRSRKNVVQFNLDTFRELSPRVNGEAKDIYNEGYDLVGSNLDNYYVGKKTGGYVNVKWYELKGKDAEHNSNMKHDMLTYMFDRMEELLALGYKKKDMLILVRTKNESQQVLKVFRELIKPDTEGYEHLKAAGKIVSSDSFLLESSVAVSAIVSGLKMVQQNDPVAEAYIRYNCPEADVEAVRKLGKYLPLNDLIEQITRLCLCPDGQYKGADIAHLNCFRDKMRSYVARYGSNLEEFLVYWDDKMHKSAVPATESDDIRIMTIHSAKGLQAKNVFMPFCDWDMVETGNKAPVLWCEDERIEMADGKSGFVPVTFSEDMNAVGLGEYYNDEKKKMRIDALNLFYVACTRAEDNLFVLPTTLDNDSTIGGMVHQLYPDQEEWGELQLPEKPKDTQKQEMAQPFSFEKAEAIPATYQTTSTNIVFRQSQQSRQLMQQMSDASQGEVENMEFGNLCHAILERVQTKADVETAVNDSYLRGQIPSQKEKEVIRKHLNRLMEHPTAGQWFDGSWQLLREDTVFVPVQQTDGSIVMEERRMDRVMIKDGEAIVLDYKFGVMKAGYETQVREYMDIMRKMGYSSVRGYLWLGFKGELLEVER